MSMLFLLAVFGIGAVVGSLVTFWLERRPRKLSPKAIGRMNRIYAEIAAQEINQPRRRAAGYGCSHKVIALRGLIP
jgi:hypothetical protein